MARLSFAGTETGPDAARYRCPQPGASGLGAGPVGGGGVEFFDGPGDHSQHDGGRLGAGAGRLGDRETITGAFVAGHGHGDQEVAGLVGLDGGALTRHRRPTAA